MIQPNTTTETAPTVWGLAPRQLHDRYWASRGVQVVRCGQRAPLIDDAELFMLAPPHLLTLFNLARPVELLGWGDLDVLWLRLRAAPEVDYRERIMLDDNGAFTGFNRVYGLRDERSTRVVLTPDRDLAAQWQAAPNSAAGGRALRAATDPVRRSSLKLAGRSYYAEMDQQVMRFLRELVRSWPYPNATIDGLQRVGPQVWSDGSHDGDAQFVGPAWIGAGRRLSPDDAVVGPAVLWDDPTARSAREDDELEWHEVEPTTASPTAAPAQPRGPSSPYLLIKRAMDIALSLLILLVIWPVFPVVALLIYLEDGWPVLFAHHRETRGGKEFACLKFRSMRTDAEQIKTELAKENQADGPQFFIEGDPRLTRIGPFIRRYHIDELPQLFNVLAGHMSLVGPRPSPFVENQYCPAWREARLSVRPGLTGLWQVSRTRREGEDFQEWIKYDIEYVESASLRLDLLILWRTIGVVLRGK